MRIEMNEMKNIHIHLFLAYFSITKRYQINETKTTFKTATQTKTKTKLKSKTFITRDNVEEKQNIQILCVDVNTNKLTDLF